MENKRLNLADFKAKAEKVETNDVLEKVQGGDASECHGFWGGIYKVFVSTPLPLIDDYE